MVAHVCAQDDGQDDFPGLAPLLLAQVDEDVALLLSQDLIQHDAVHVLQRTAVVVLQGQLVLGLHQEEVVDARVANIMSQCAHQQGQHLQWGEDHVELGNHDQAVGGVTDVTAVVVVVVGVVDIAPRDVVQELAEDLLGDLELAQQGQVAEHEGDDVGQVVVRELQHVEVEGVQHVLGDLAGYGDVLYAGGGSVFCHVHSASVVYVFLRALACGVRLIVVVVVVASS